MDYRQFNTKQELPEDNEARRVEGVWSQGQGQRGQSLGVHGEVLSKGMCVLNIKGVPQFL